MSGIWRWRENNRIEPEYFLLNSSYFCFTSLYITLFVIKGHFISKFTIFFKPWNPSEHVDFHQYRFCSRQCLLCISQCRILFQVSICSYMSAIHASSIISYLTKHNSRLLGKVILMNQLDAKMIYWSIRSAQHVSGNIFPIIGSVRLRYLQHMVSCCCGG